MDYDKTFKEFEKVHCNLQQGTGIEMVASMAHRFGTEELVLMARWLESLEPVEVEGAENPTHLPHIRYERSSWDAFVGGGFLMPAFSTLDTPGRKARFYRFVGKLFRRHDWYLQGRYQIDNRKVLKEAWFQLRERQQMEREQQQPKEEEVGS